jgi:hypothetical protein
MACRRTIRGEESGFVLLTVILAAVFLLATLAVVATLDMTSSNLSAETANAAQAQNLAMSAQSWFFSCLESHPAYFSTGPSNSTSTQQTDCPYVNVDNDATSGPPTTQPWARFGASGQIEACPDPSGGDQCFSIVVSEPTGNEASAAQLGAPTGQQGVDQGPRTVVVQTTADVGCGAGGAGLSAGKLCRQVKIQSLLERRTYLDYLYFTNYQTLDPNNPALWPTGVSTTTCGPNPDLPSGTLQPYWTAPPSANCSEVLPVYIGDGTSNPDIESGPIHTNDAYIPVCGSPVFGNNANIPGSGLVEVNDAYGQTTPYFTPPGCEQYYNPSAGPQGNSSPSDQNTTGEWQSSDIALPTGTSFSTLLNIANGGDGATCATNPADGVYQGNTTITLVGAAYFAAPGNVLSSLANPVGTLEQFPPSGLIVVCDGNATVSGVLGTDAPSNSGPPIMLSSAVGIPAHLTIVAYGGAVSNAQSGNIYISGSVQYACAGTGYAAPDMSGCGPTSDMLGLIAGGCTTANTSGCQSGTPIAPGYGNIVIGTANGTDSTYNPTTPMTVDAGMLTNNGSIYVQGWSTDGIGAATFPTLYIEGAMASEYRGAFGAYQNITTTTPSATPGGKPTVTTTTEVTSGYVKDFAWDPRFLYEQPPWFMQPAASSWVRTDTAVVPAGQCGFSPNGTQVPNQSGCI